MSNSLLTTPQQVDLLSRGSILAPLGRVGLDGPPGDVELGMGVVMPFAMQLVSVSYSMGRDLAGPTTDTISVTVQIGGVVIPATILAVGIEAGAVGEIDLVQPRLLDPGVDLYVQVDPDFGGAGQVAGSMFLTAVFRPY